MRHGRHTYGFPLRAYAQLMFYRTDVLAEIGMEPARTWDDVVAIADAIRAKGLDIEPLALYFHNDGNRQKRPSPFPSRPAPPIPHFSPSHGCGRGSDCFCRVERGQGARRTVEYACAP